jgi:hypothetical protein
LYGADQYSVTPGVSLPCGMAAPPPITRIPSGHSAVTHLSRVPWSGVMAPTTTRRSAGGSSPEAEPSA